MRVVRSSNFLGSCSWEADSQSAISSGLRLGSMFNLLSGEITGRVSVQGILYLESANKRQGSVERILLDIKFDGLLHVLIGTCTAYNRFPAH